MATLATRISDLATRIAQEINTVRAERGRSLQGSVAGKPIANQLVGGGIAPYPITLVEADCSAIALTAATASTVFIIKRWSAGTATQIGTITFGAGAKIGVVDITSAAIAEDQQVTIHAPATADATLADISFSLKGN